jgi:hypothetical protein
MDEIVKAALKNWLPVPPYRRWLGLGVRGNWYMRDGRAQRAGPSPQVKDSSRAGYRSMRPQAGAPATHQNTVSAVWYCRRIDPRSRPLYT